MLLPRRLFLATAAAPLARLRAQPPKPRLPRKDCFFGIHFDLHPQKRDTALGRDVTEEMIERFLAQVKPDYVQYDCKGHAGYLGYPSKVGTSSPGIVKDSLEIWRRVTARHGVALFIHFSGVWDSLAVEQHPEWARGRPDGKPEPNQTSTFGPYVDELMIPQLKEAAARYDLDGAWVDGECWATNPDYSPAAARAFREATAISELPKGPRDRGWLEFLEFNRAQFRRHVRHYVDALHAARPGFQIASNWLYSTMVPERPDLPVDYISGDYLGNASISTARLEARYMSQTGMPWDLMAWGFVSGRATPVGPVHKPAAQLQQEAAVVLAQGGGFQIYYQPTRTGHIDDRHTGVMSRVARFCRARQALSHKTDTVPQVGVVFSTRSLYRAAGKLFGGWGAASNPARGWVDALLENHYSVDVLPEWKLEQMARSYPLIVAPDWPDLGEKVRDVLAGYVKQGGQLLVAGAANAVLFRDLLQVKLSGQAADQLAFVPGEEVFANVKGIWQHVELAGAEALFERYPTCDSTRDGKCAATFNRVAAGAVVAVYGPIGTVFATTHAAAVRQVARRLVERLFTPTISMEGPPTVEMALRKKGDMLLVHLLNSTAMQVAGEYVNTDFIPPVGPLRLSLRLKNRPRRATFHPEGRALAGVWKDGVWSALIDRLEIHGLLALEGAGPA
ncbi:MAG: hypothetical protein FJW34_21980 [Acidobacteria bacterium]|nr:hypothetical protein [Acidobacteriota bacterium]